jgi:hypothetical protein
VVGAERGGCGVHAHAGDRIVVESAHVGQGRREGKILEVLADNGNEHYRVAWDDDHESIYFPSSDAHVVGGKGQSGS